MLSPFNNMSMKFSVHKRTFLIFPPSLLCYNCNQMGKFHQKILMVCIRNYSRCAERNVEKVKYDIDVQYIQQEKVIFIKEYLMHRTEYFRVKWISELDGLRHFIKICRFWCYSIKSMMTRDRDSYLSLPGEPFFFFLSR